MVSQLKRGFPSVCRNTFPLKQNEKRKREAQKRQGRGTTPLTWTLTNIRYYNKVNMPSSRILARHCLPGCCGRGAALLCWCTALVKGQYM